MKTSVTKIVAATVFGAGLLLGSTTWAGQVSHPQVSVFANSSAQGSMYGARRSADTTQYIGCTLNAGPSGANVGCSARNSAGTYIACNSTNAYHREAVTAMTAYSWLYFTINATTGECRNVVVRNDSMHLP
jgi:hypothetical protein